MFEWPKVYIRTHNQPFKSDSKPIAHLEQYDGGTQVRYLDGELDIKTYNLDVEIEYWLVEGKWKRIYPQIYFPTEPKSWKQLEVYESGICLVRYEDGSLTASPILPKDVPGMVPHTLVELGETDIPLDGCAILYSWPRSYRAQVWGDKVSHIEQDADGTMYLRTQKGERCPIDGVVAEDWKRIYPDIYARTDGGLLTPTVRQLEVYPRVILKRGDGGSLKKPMIWNQDHIEKNVVEGKWKRVWSVVQDGLEWF